MKAQGARDQSMLYIIYQEDREDGAAEIRAANRERHLAYRACRRPHVHT
jgi:hypothetical protein